MSQVEKVLDDLRAAGRDGVCSSHWYATFIPNSRNRIGELTKAGYIITSEPCRDDHGRTTFYRYRLVSVPNPKQLTLVVA